MSGTEFDESIANERRENPMKIEKEIADANMQTGLVFPRSSLTILTPGAFKEIAI